MLKSKKIRWGIIGLGRISRLFAKDLKLITDSELVAVASTNASRANDFAREFHVAQAYASYEELFKDANVDVVYVATLHNTHCKFSIEAMTHGKHVLCEKPVAINASQTAEMINISKEKNVFFMEAFWTRFNPSIIKIQELISRDTIGKLRYINAEFTFYKLDDDTNSRLLNVDMAGGSLLDMGVYPIFLSYLLLGVPNEILARSQFFKTGVEIQTSIIFQYENAQAMIYSGIANNTDMRAKICGEAGEIYIHPFWFEAQGFELVKKGKSQFFDLPTIGKGYAHEILEVHDCIKRARTESEKWRHKDSLKLMRLVDKIRQQSEINFPFEL